MYDLTHFKEELRRRLPLSQVVGSHMRLQAQSGQIHKGLCPFHKEKTPSFYVYDANANYHCFGCGLHGDAIDFLERTENLTFMEALSKMAHMAGMAMPDLKGEAPSHTRFDQLYAVCEEATRFFEVSLQGNEGYKARAYLEKRLVLEKTQKHFRLGYAPSGTLLWDHLKAKGFSDTCLMDAGLFREHKDRPQAFFWNRLMFPITDRMGKVIAFGGRSVDGGQPKYLNSADTPLFHKGRELYNHKEARINRQNLPLIVVEGYMDVIALHDMDCRAVATLGTAFTSEHVSLLWRLSSHPLLCFDGDEAGQRASFKAMGVIFPLLEADKTFSFLTLPQGMDPADYRERNREVDFHKLLKTPLSLFDFLWNAKKIPATTPDAQANLEKSLMDDINSIQNKDIKIHAIKWVKHKLSDYFWHMRLKKHQAHKPLGSRQELPRVTAKDHYAKVLIALMVHYPGLVVEFEEEMGSFALPQPFNALKEAIIAYCYAEKVLDKTSLSTHLKDKGYANLLQQTITEAMIMAPLMKSDAPYEQIKDLWLKIKNHDAWQHHKQENMKELMGEFKEELNESRWRQIQHFRNVVKTQETSLFKDTTHCDDDYI